MEAFEFKLSLNIADSEELTRALRHLERYLKNEGVTVEWPMEPPAPGELGGKKAPWLLIIVMMLSDVHPILERWEQEYPPSEETERKHDHTHDEESTIPSGKSNPSGPAADSLILKLSVKTESHQQRVDNLHDLERYLQGVHIPDMIGIDVEAEKFDGKTVALRLIVRLPDSSMVLEKIDNTLKRIHDWQVQHHGIAVILRLTGKQSLDDHIQQEIQRNNYNIEVKKPLILLVPQL